MRDRVSVEADALLGDGALLDDGLLLVEDDFVLLLGDLGAGARVVAVGVGDRLAFDADLLVADRDGLGHLLGHDVLAQAHTAALARLGADAQLACPAGERHTFGLTAFGIALHELGWRIVYLGADTPAAMIAVAADAVVPDLIVIAAVTPVPFDDEREALRALAMQWTCALAGAGADAATSARLGARHLADNPITAATAL